MKTTAKPAKVIPPEFPYVTGFCGVGNHAGTTNISTKGTKQTTCNHVYFIGRFRTRVECMCWCHDAEREFRAMMASAGKPVDENPLPVYALPVRTLQGLAHDVASPVKQATVSTPFGDRPAINMLPGGRLARGELEKLVYEVITDKLVGIGKPGAGDGTPKWINMEIQLRTNQATNPSAGAIYSCLEKWAKLMLITVAEKPYRVTAVSDKLRLD
jgi:hypothetical protein